MSFTILERIDTAVRCGSDLDLLLILLQDAADHIRDLEAAATEADGAEKTHNALIADMKAVLADYV